MTFFSERYIRHGQAFLAQSVYHHFGLIWQDDFVFQALKENYGSVQFVRVMDRRTLVIKFFRNQSECISRFKFMRVFVKRLQVADAVVAGSGGENIFES